MGYMSYLVDMRPFDKQWLQVIDTVNGLVLLYTAVSLYLYTGLLVRPEDEVVASEFNTMAFYGILGLNGLVAIYNGICDY